MHVVSLLEKEFGRAAIKEMLPMQPGDVPQHTLISKIWPATLGVGP
jgi:hypothetical protein